MCIIFLYLGDRDQKLNHRFILAANRDESLQRPSALAEFWTDHPQILAGRDLMKGRDGGTWLGFTKSGHIGALTNLIDREGKKTLKNRGPLVKDYLACGGCPLEYTIGIGREKDSYHGFNLVVGKISRTGEDALYFINNSSKNNWIQRMKGVSCISNGGLDRSWSKVKNGTKAFQKIIHQKVSEDDMIDNLLDFLHDKTRYCPEKDGSNTYLKGRDLGDSLSSIFVEDTEAMLGTRAKTVIMVDYRNNVTFVEQAMADPINLENPDWITTKHRFVLEDDFVQF